MDDQVPLTPMLQQYWQIRRQFDDPNTILFYRLGDFYEMFFEDAKVASGILDITLTSRNRNDPNPVPLCGVPYHAADGYIAKLLAAGKKIAVCEQVEDPKLAKGVVKREVVRLITPGAVMATAALPTREHNYLAAVTGKEGRFGLAVADISTGELLATQCRSAKALADELTRLDVREVLFPKQWQQEGMPTVIAAALEGRAGTALENAQFDPDQCPQLDGQAAVLAECPAALPALGAIGAYVAFTHRAAPNLTRHFQRVTAYHVADYLIVDETVQRHLEIFRSAGDGRREGSLLHLLDRTETAMGARRLKHWLLQQLTAPLRRVSDCERITGRLVAGTASPRDCIALRDSLDAVTELRQALQEAGEGLLALAFRHLDPLPPVRDDIAATLVDDPPQNLTEGGYIRPGHLPELDALRRLQHEGKGFIAGLEASERTRTGIHSLKVRYNKVFGYYIEITHAHRDKIPGDYIRKQTLTNAERYITPELKAYEEKILTAAERIAAIEQEAFRALRERLAHAAPQLKTTAEWIGTVDALGALATTALANNYCRPEIVAEPVIRITKGRHPVVEQLAAERFVANDTTLDANDARLLIITGPNMAGKSTVMRQTALITLMAHIGSFVPAEAATIGLTDRIFTRVGATDYLTRGQSTFMVEMAEAATICQEATARSLIVIDEIGRGTSTYDGVAIAWAVAEYLHDHVRARTPFATHFHELADLALTKAGARNYTMAVKEWNDKVIFLRAFVPGAVNRSYGIQVGKLAGLPDLVIDRAREVLNNLERGELNEVGQPTLARHEVGETAAQSGQLTLYHETSGPQLLQELATLDPNAITPLEALALLQQWKSQLKG
ncbi:MAG: DNA mismatch repair protein MutS [Deltaproteobacteria bacterium]|nr:DNA mismatch repair protein MutS [Deltaproteobacteria bacterium]